MLHIVTPVSRPWNLAALDESLRRGIRRTPYAWWVVFDVARTTIPPRPIWCDAAYWGPGDGRTGAVGYPQRNWALDRIDDGWVYFLDDDNLIHPDMERVWEESLQAHPDADWFVFRQVRRDGTTYLPPHCPPRVGRIDVGQGIMKRERIGRMRFPADRYDADGALFERLALDRGPCCVDHAAAYYNALR